MDLKLANPLVRVCRRTLAPLPANMLSAVSARKQRSSLRWKDWSWERGHSIE
ncbi:hypothetical protein OIDMADRAFT_21582 [Oidiodendron maius Zn]|uniref:Uncharacterized protein n=1 Tax=Oidiodendron maius (strain Zn) TaxID=913774 RepID=A0A0C3GN52_OIDMZ|nr:hypothetical protein OIDMADRAFT_21582 [Oidiodendron maius Zn]